MEPINLFNAAFAKSDKFIDAHASDPYMKAYLKANTAQAKPAKPRRCGEDRGTTRETYRWSSY